MRFEPLAVAALFALPPIAPAQTRRMPPLAPGPWMIGAVARGDTAWNWATLRFAGDSVHGDMGPPQRSVHGVVRGDSIELVQYWDSTSVRARFRGTIRDGRLTGTRLLGARPGAALTDTSAWFATAQPVRSGPPRAISFEPVVFHRRFSGAIAPALHIFPGDTVKTRTIDATGIDWAGTKRSNGGNPETGPFFIEGAMPGDVIAIHLHRVRLNRDFALAGSSIVSGALTPGLARGLPDVPGFDGRWKLDRARGVAMLDKPTPVLAHYEIAVRPMLGCIGVAPAQKQSIRTADSGPFGGNMDYNELREGATVYLTVNEPGALLFVGDGHAVQGDGELTGDALETSMDLEFSVDIVRGITIGGPRADNAEYLMSIGIAGDLQEALRVATADMARWLAGDYKLNSAELASILGTALRYDVADLVGTQISIVAKVPRAVLANLPPAAITPEAYAAELREIIRQAPLLSLESSPILVSPPAVGWELGFVSWLTTDRKGLIYLFQRGNQADPIVVLDRQGRIVRSWGKGLYQTPHSIRLDPDGNVWTTDAKSSIVTKFTPNGRKLLEISVGGVPKDCATAFCGTTDVGFGPRGSVFVADGYRNARILEYTATGRLVREWGHPGTGPGEFQLPHSIVVDEAGIIYVADRENGRVQLFDLEGRYLREWPKYGKTFSLALAPGVIWLATQHRNEPNLAPGWLLKVDRRSGAVVGYVNATGVHGMHAGPGGELLIAPGPERKPQVFRSPH